jgi:hypothetical protein
LVAWWEQSGPNYATRIYARAFDANGVPLTQAPTLIDEFTAFPEILGLASTGQGYLLTYVKYNGKWDAIVGAKIADDGSITDPNALNIDIGNHGPKLFRLDASRSGYLLTFLDIYLDDVFLLRLDASANRLTTPEVRIYGNAPITPTVYGVASDGTDHLVAFCDPSTISKYSEPCPPQGLLIRADGTALRLKEPLGPAGSAGALIWDGNAYVYSWRESNAADPQRAVYHFTEIAIDATGQARMKDQSLVDDFQHVYTDNLALDQVGLRWSRTAMLGYPNQSHANISKIHHRTLTGLCLGDPLGDSNENGICDSKEQLTTPNQGAGGGSSNTQSVRMDPSSSVSLGGSAQRTGMFTPQGGRTSTSFDESHVGAEGGNPPSESRMIGGSPARTSTTNETARMAKRDRQRSLEGGGCDCRMGPTKSPQGPTPLIYLVLGVLLCRRNSSRNPGQRSRLREAKPQLFRGGL